MRRALLFASRFAIGLLLVTLCSVGWLMVSMSPNQIDGGIASVSIFQDPQDHQNHLRIPGHQFACTEQGVTDHCQFTLRDQPLKMTVIYENEVRKQFASDVKCQATYAGRPVNCGVSYDFASGTLPNLSIQDSLGLSNQDLQALRQQYFFAQFNDDRWMQLTSTIAIIAGLITTMFIWLYTGQQLINSRNVQVTKLVASVNGGIFVFGLLWGSFFMSLLGLNLID
ncbi:hypothetical protein H6F94_04000 [Leptolyngbya sp. FACHB-261]|nr:hypothetical protein [Leptolyngbya sp. FACHB-261]